MDKKKMIEAIAEGIKGELDGITIYEEAASRSEGDVKSFFLERAAEEKMHYNWLASYYQRLIGTDGGLEEDILPGKLPDEPSPVISAEFLERIGTDRYLSAAISSSVLLELNAVEHYRKNADTATDAGVAELFTRLSEWEMEHYEILLKIQEESRQSWFKMQNFAPF